MHSDIQSDCDRNTGSGPDMHAKQVERKNA